MKKYLLSIFALTALVGCSKENINDGNDNNSDTPQFYTAPLTIDLNSQEATRAFDAEWNWEWSDADTIYVCQDAGERFVTPMTHIGDGKFYGKVAYSTQEPANFYFIYGGKIKHEFENGVYSTSYITPQHSAIWTPVMVGTQFNTTINEITEVMMFPLSGAIEIRAWDYDRTTPAKIKKATIKAAGANIGLKWDNTGNPIISNDGHPDIVPDDEVACAYCKEGSSTLFINLPPFAAEDFVPGVISLEVVNLKDEVIDVTIPQNSIVIGKRSVINIVANTPNYAEISKPKEFYNQIVGLASSIDPTVTNKMKFIANSNINTQSAIKISGISNSYATLSEDFTTLEIHTPKAEFYVKKGVDIGNMFLFGEMITSLDLGDNFNTENVTKMDSLFLGLQNMEYLHLGKSFTTKNVTDMSGMFAACLTLENWDFIKEFDTSNTTNMSMMFMFSSINNADFSKWDTSNVTDMSNMFLIATQVQALDLSSFDTSKVTTMKQMFTTCANIGELNLSSFDFSLAPDVTEMFDDTPTANPGSITIDFVPMGNEYFKNTGQKAKVYISQQGYDYFTTHSAANFPNECAEFVIVE